MSRTRRTTQFSGETLNRIQIKLPALSVNESMARAAVAAFVSQLDPGVTEIADIKCAVSEAVTNAIVHGYRDSMGEITMTVRLLEPNTVEVTVTDRGCGIPDVQQARQPLFTTGGADRSGMGFTIMESFTDGIRVRSAPGKGTTVTLRKAMSLRAPR
jgi:stage II sporulation protein AB (anti-sigma F factor)